MGFKLSCPRCGAAPEKANLTVVSGEFTAMGMYLTEDGFAFGEASHVATENEKVACDACGESNIPLGECLDDEEVSSAVDEEWQCLDPACVDAAEMPYHSHKGPQRLPKEKTDG